MTTIAAISTTTDRMRETLAFGLNTLDSLGLEPYLVEATSGDRLYVYLQDQDAEEAGRALFAALGGHRHRENRQEKTWSIFSSAPSDWDPEGRYASPNVPLGDRMIEVSVSCTVTPREEESRPGA